MLTSIYNIQIQDTVIVPLINDSSQRSKKVDTIIEIKDNKKSNPDTAEQIISEKKSEILIPSKDSIKKDYPLYCFRPATLADNITYLSDKSIDSVFTNNFIFNQVEKVKFSRKDSSSAKTINTETTTTSVKKVEEFLEKEVYKSDWLLVFVLTGLLFFSIVRAFYNKYLTSIFKSNFNYQLSFKLFREKSLVIERISLLMNIIFVIELTIFIFLLAVYYQTNTFFQNSFLLFLVISGIISFIYITKYAVYKIVGSIVNSQAIVNEYLFNVFLYNKIVGIFLLPITIGIIYMPNAYTLWLFTLGAFVIFFYFIMRIFRGLQISLKTSMSIYYIILYLCTLEILPIIVLIKIIALNI
jgi:hypothetical protein